MATLSEASVSAQALIASFTKTNLMFTETLAALRKFEAENGGTLPDYTNVKALLNSIVAMQTATVASIRVINQGFTL